MARRALLGVAGLMMVVVPLAMPSGSSTLAARHLTPTTAAAQQLLAEQVSRVVTPSGTSTSAHARPPSAAYLAWRAQSYRTWRARLYHQWQVKVAAHRYAVWHAKVVAARLAAARARAAVAAPAVHRAVATYPAPSKIHGYRVGVATWYNWHVGQCASSYRPKGTRIWVHDLDNGRTISCLVTDAQPYSPSRVVDLNETQFAQLAPLAQGVIHVRVTW